MHNMYMKVERTNEKAMMPVRGTEESAGLDFFTPEYIEIAPGESTLINLKLKIAIHDGYALVFVEKSGLAVKKGIRLGARVVDSDYRGEVMVNLFNDGEVDAKFMPGEKITQGIIIPIWTGIPEEVEFISENTERGTGGFGSTGD